MGKSLGILSLKGGVGKTSSTVALGSALADFGKKVLLVDANLSSPNLGMHLNIISPDKTLHDVLNRKANITEAIQSFGKFDVLPSSIFSSFVKSPLQLKDKLRSVKRKYDYILIDSSPALNDETLAAMLASDELIVVSTPDYSTLSSTLKAVRSAKERKMPIVGMVLNKVYGKDFEIPISSMESVSQVPVMAIIPHDTNVLKAQSKFLPYPDFKPKSDGAIEYKKLAATLLGEKYKTFRWKNIFKLSPTLSDVNREVYYQSVFE